MSLDKTEVAFVVLALGATLVFVFLGTMMLVFGSIFDGGPNEKENPDKEKDGGS